MGINSSNGNGFHHPETNGNGHGNNGQSAKRPKPPHIVLSGPQGVGKGTQSLMLVEAYGYTHVESGGAFRALSKNGESDLAKQIKEFSERGELVPDELTMRVMEPYLQFDEKPILLDGIPRSPGQARILQQMLGERNYLVVIMNLSREECVKRIAQRVEELEAKGLPVRADDKNPEAVQKRLDIYGQETAEALTGSFPEERIFSIDASADIGEVGAQIRAKIDALMSERPILQEAF